jgi:hypothetical protein
MTKTLLFIAAVLCATPAFAQTSVAAALGADLTKSYESTTNGATFPDSEREAIAWALRLGTALGSRWGVELEFNRAGELEMQNGPIAYQLAAGGPGGFTWSSSSLGSVGSGILDLGASPVRFPVPEVRTDQRNTTWNASGWFGQPLGGRAELAVLAGVGFSRVVQNTDYSISGPPQLLALIPIAQRSYRTRIIDYGVGPLVGAEVRIRMTDHVALTPGIRVQSLGNNLAPGLLLRPAVALGWTF